MSGRRQILLVAIICLGSGVVIGRWVTRSGAMQQAGGPSSLQVGPAAASPGTSSPSEAAHHVTPVVSLSALERLREASSRVSATNLLLSIAAIAEMSVSDCRAARDLFARWPEEERNLLHRLIAARWATLDAEGALACALTDREPQSQLLLIREATRALMKRGVDDAIAKLPQLATLLERRLFGRFVVEVLAEEDPARAAGLLVSRPELIRDEDLFSSVGARWARMHPQEAFAWAASLPGGRVGADAMRGVLTSWAEHDPAAAARELDRLSGRRLDPDVYSSVTREWSKSDPAAALAWLRTIAADEPSRAGWNGFNPIVRVEDGAAMLELVKSIESAHYRALVADRISTQLAQQNPRQAVAWAEMLEGETRRYALRPVIAEWARSEPAEAVAYAAGLPYQNRLDVLRPAFGRWANIDPEAAMLWTRQLPEGGEREQLAAEASRAVRELKPEKAVAWLDMIHAPELRRSVVDEIAANWGRTDGPAAAAWLQTLPDDEMKVRSHRSLARQWAFADSDATAQWLATLPSGGARDAAVDAFVSSVDGYDPALATVWATAIEDAQRRPEKVASAWGRWMERDAVAARAWLDEATLEPDLRAKLLGIAERKTR